MDHMDNDRQSELDRAIARRLAKLRTMPVDTAHLDNALRAKLSQSARSSRLTFMRWRPVRAIAASVAVLVVIGVILISSTGGPVLASAAQMAQVHEDMVAGRAPVMQVDSIAQANKMLAAHWPQSPMLPGVPQDHVMACCMKSVKSKKVACVLLKSEGVPITMTVANASDMQLPASSIISRNGIEYRVQSVGKLDMVMTERNGRWICLIGQVPAERLMDLAAKLQF